ncbi:MAG: hypothetical protein IPP66_20490 [Anaerolineales bacterium]|nr:hypothetical protein [Anaerolineales bacterium]
MDDNLFSNPFDKNEQNMGMKPIDSGEGDTSGRSLVWFLIGIIAIGCLCFFGAALLYYQPDVKTLYAQYFPSPTSTLTATPVSTSTPIPTPTNTPTPTPNMTATAIAIQATDTALAYQATAENAATKWKVIRTDTFDSNKNDWLVESNSEDEYSTTSYEVVDGKYRWDTTAHQSYIGWVRAGRKVLKDFYLSVDIQAMEAPETADYGVVFREDEDSNFYYFGINEQGEYALYVYFKEWSTLIDWTKTDLVKLGKANRITVIGEGSHFTFFINNQYLTEFTDDTLTKGSTALAVELTDTDDHALIEFDNFDLRAP